MSLTPFGAPKFKSHIGQSSMVQQWIFSSMVSQVSKTVFYLDLVTCSDTAETRPDSFTVDCPAGCDLTAANVYGTEVYAQQSSICAAAVHDGRILGTFQEIETLRTSDLTWWNFVVDHGGTVDVNKITGKSSYSGSYANGVQSQDYTQSEYSFTFQGNHDALKNIFLGNFVLVSNRCSTISTGDHLGCKNGWHGWQNWCYYTPRHSEGLNWADSRDYCQKQGGDLASVHSQAEQDFVSTLIFFQCKFEFHRLLEAKSSIVDCIFNVSNFESLLLCELHEE